MKRLYFTFSLFVMMAFSTSAQSLPLPSTVSAMLKKHRIPMASMSVELKRLDKPDTLLSINASVPRNPASVMKLVTTLTALELLGPTYSWRTRYYIDGQILDGQLDGNLVLKGGGDPSLVTELFRHQLYSLRNLGLKTINGDLIIDNSAVRPNSENRGKFDGKSDRVYNVIPTATSINYSATKVILRPEENGIRIYTDPPATNLKIVNNMVAIPGRCRSRWSGWSFKSSTEYKKMVLNFQGKYPHSCGQLDFTRAILSNAEYTYGVFKSLWQRSGGTLNGQGRLQLRPRSSALFHVATSKPLTDVITGVNKFSNNIMARQLFLTLGRESFGIPGTPEKGFKAVKQWLQSEHISMPELVMENGAGLSRISRISANSLSKLLRRGWDSSYRPEFLASLSLAAIDGTMRKRLKKEAPAGRVRIKTGLLYKTRAMAGYVKGKNGAHYSVVMLLSHPTVTYWSGNQVQDALLKWLIHI